jgi:hypothetical protein
MNFVEFDKQFALTSVPRAVLAATAALSISPVAK